MSKVVEMEGYGKATINELGFNEALNLLELLSKEGAEELFAGIENSESAFKSGFALILKSAPLVKKCLDCLKGCIDIKLDNGKKDFPARYMFEIFDVFSEVNSDFLAKINPEVTPVV